MRSQRSEIKVQDMKTESAENILVKLLPKSRRHGRSKEHIWPRSERAGRLLLTEKIVFTMPVVKEKRASVAQIKQEI